MCGFMRDDVCERDDVAVTDRDMVKSSLVEVLCGSVRDELGVGLLKSNRDFKLKAHTWAL